MAEITKKSAAKKTAARKAEPAAPKKAAAKKAAPRKKTAAAPVAVTPEQRQQYIAEAAYYRAEQQGFQNDPVENWLEAEAEVDAWLSSASVH